MAQNIPVTNDLMFQSIFGRIGNERITKGFLEKVLGIEIEGLTLDTNKRLIGEEIDDKRGRLDVKAVLKDGTKVIIEMQVEPYDYIPKRIIFYCARVYAEGLKKGDSYEDIKRTIGLLIMKNNLKITKDIKEYHTKWSLREEGHPEVELTEDFKIHIIELEKFNEEAEEDIAYDWIKFVKEGVNMGKPLRYDEMLEEAREELIRLEEDSELREKYESRIDYLRDQISAMQETKRKAEAEGLAEGLAKGMEKGIAEGMAEGLAKGEAKKQKEVIINMYNKGINIEDICDIVNLPKKQVKEIIKHN